MKGFVKTFGDLALSLESEDRRQFYAPYANVDSEVLQYLIPFNKMKVPVQFNVDRTKCAGTSHMGNRYYATDVKLQNVEINLIL